MQMELTRIELDVITANTGTRLQLLNSTQVLEEFELGKAEEKKREYVPGSRVVSHGNDLVASLSDANAVLLIDTEVGHKLY